MRARRPLSVRLFRRWFRDAQNAGEPLPEAMALATAIARWPAVGPHGAESRRSAAAASSSSRTTTAARPRSSSANPRAAVVFHWPLLERQLRVEGRVHKLTRRESERYFQTPAARQPHERVGIAAEREIPDERFLKKKFARAQERFGWKTHSVSAVLGRLPDCRELYRVLAGTAAPLARSCAFIAKRKRAGRACSLHRSKLSTKPF